VVNKTKKEYINLSTIGKNNRKNGYTLFFPQLIGYLVLSEWGGYGEGKCNSNHENGFEGHWAGDNIQLVSEHREEYDIAKGLCDDRVFNKKTGHYEWVQINKEESDQWVDITIPLVKDWNKSIEEGFIEDESKKELIVDLTYLDKPRRVVDIGPRLDKAIEDAFKD
jgi:hypothetical protein